MSLACPVLALGNRSGAPRRMPWGVGADLELSNREFDWPLSLLPGGSQGLETLGISQALPVMDPLDHTCWFMLTR